MDDEFISIVFEERGYSHSLVSTTDFVEAISNRSILPDSMVKRYRRDGTFTQWRAEDVPLLRRIFRGEDILSPATAASTPISEPPTVSPVPSPTLKPNSVLLPWREKPRPTSVAPPVRKAPEAPGRETSGKGRWIVLALIAGGLIFVIAGLSSKAPCQVQGSDEPSRLNCRETGAEARYFLTATANVRPLPSTQEDSLGSIVRGEAIQAVPVDNLETGAHYLLIKSGDHEGHFVWAGATSDVSPPSLYDSPGRRIVAKRTFIRSQPQWNAEPVRRARRGEKLTVAGYTSDRWFEVMNDEASGGVLGYIHESKIR